MRCILLGLALRIAVRAQRDAMERAVRLAEDLVEARRALAAERLARDHAEREMRELRTALSVANDLRGR